VSFTKQQQISIRRAISEARFLRYSTYCNDDVNKALELYQWNLEVSSAFALPLNFFEVTIRNATSEAIEKVYGDNWVRSAGFQRSLPTVKKDKKGYDQRNDLVQLATHKKNYDANHIIVNLQFIFWEKMFASGQDNPIWQRHLKNIFPNIPSTYTYQNIQDVIKQIRPFRNRVAHYEPIFDRDLQKDYKIIHDFLSWRDLDLADWIHSIQNVQSILAKKP